MQSKRSIFRWLGIVAAVGAIAAGQIACALVERDAPPAPTAVYQVEPDVPAGVTLVPAATSAPTRPLPSETPAEPTPTAEEVVGQVEVLETIYAQDFAGPAAEWKLELYEDEAVGVTYSIRDGKFAWEVESKRATTLIKTAVPEIRLPQGDFLASVVIEANTGDSNISAGILFRFQDFKNFYFAKLTQTGQVAIYAFENASWTNLVDFTQSEHFRPNQPNRLTVVEKNGSYEVQVNDIPEVSFKDSRFRDGSMALIVEMNDVYKVTFAFDDVLVMAPGGGAAYAEEGPAARPTMMPMGASWETFNGTFGSAGYQVDYPRVFTYRQSGEWEVFCLDAPEHLCLSVRAMPGNWENPQNMADEIMGEYRDLLGEYAELHAQSSRTSQDLAAYWVGYQGNRDGAELEGSRLFVIQEQVGFDIAAEGTPVMMEVYREIIRTMMESFRVVSR